MASYGRVCCPVDFSATSTAALDVAVDLASRLGASLTVVHVRDVVAIPWPGTPQARVDARAEAEALAKLDGVRDALAARASGDVRTLLLAGDPATEVARLLSSGDYDLAVMGTHGLTGVQRLLVGSVTERVLRHATCPVLVVRPPATAATGAPPPAGAPPAA